MGAAGTEALTYADSPQHLLQSTQNGSSLATGTNTTKPTHLYHVHCHSLGTIQISLELLLQLPSPQTIKSHGAHCLPLLNFPCLTSGPLSFLSVLNSPFSCCSILFLSLSFLSSSKGVVMASNKSRSNKTRSSKNDNSGKTPPRGQKHDVTECAICLEAIQDRSDTSEGEDLVFCEGECQRWLHRTCARLNDPAFDKIRRSDKCFYCYQCFVIVHKSEVKDLRDTVDTLMNSVKSLTKELSNLRSLLSSKAPTNQKHSANAEKSIPIPYSDVVVSKEPKVTQAQNVLSPHLLCFLY